MSASGLTRLSERRACVCFLTEGSGITIRPPLRGKSGRSAGAAEGPSLTHMRHSANPYSITSSARASSKGGTVKPSALAVLRLITSSNLVGCNTGRSVGLTPFNIRPA